MGQEVPRSAQVLSSLTVYARSAVRSSPHGTNPAHQACSTSRSCTRLSIHERGKPYRHHATKQHLSQLNSGNQFFQAKLLQHKNGQADQSSAADQMSLLLKQSQEKSDAPYSLLEPSIDARIKEMCQTVIAAGSETTGSTLTALLYYVGSAPEVLRKLLAEIEASSNDVLEDGTFPLTTVSLVDL